MNDPPRFYRSRAARREAGLENEVFDWLAYRGLLELQAARAEEHLVGGATRRKHADVVTVQLGVEVTLGKSAAGEVLFEAERDDTVRNYIDEGFLELNPRDGLEVTIGHFYPPFGEYYCNFVIGPLVEFGEVRADGVLVAAETITELELWASGMDSNLNRSRTDSGYAWGGGVVFSPAGIPVRLGAGYLSDLTESDSDLLENAESQAHRAVPGWSFHLTGGVQALEGTLELVASGEPFADLPRGEDRPVATNVEGTGFPAPRLELAGRIEFARDLPEQPQRQIGASLTWRSLPRMSVSVDICTGAMRPAANGPRRNVAQAQTPRGRADHVRLLSRSSEQR